MSIAKTQAPRNPKIQSIILWFIKKSLWDGLLGMELRHDYMGFSPSLFKATDVSSYTHLFFCVTSSVPFSVTWAFNLSGKKYDKIEGSKKLLWKWAKKYEQKHSDQSFNE